MRCVCVSDICILRFFSNRETERWLLRTVANYSPCFVACKFIRHGNQCHFTTACSHLFLPSIVYSVSMMIARLYWSQPAKPSGHSQLVFPQKSLLPTSSLSVISLHLWWARHDTARVELVMVNSIFQDSTCLKVSIIAVRRGDFAEHDDTIF